MKNNISQCFFCMLLVLISVCLYIYIINGNNIKKESSVYDLDLDLSDDYSKLFQSYQMMKIDTSKILIELKYIKNKSDVFIDLLAVLKDKELRKEITPVYIFVLQNMKSIKKIIFMQKVFWKEELIRLNFNKNLCPGSYTIRVGYTFREQLISDSNILFYTTDVEINIQ